MFEIPCLTLQFVTTECPNGRVRCGNFGVSIKYMAWTRFLRWAFFDWCISLWVAIKMEKGVFLKFPVKDIQPAAPLWQNFKGLKNIQQFSIPSILLGKAKLSMASCFIYVVNIHLVLVLRFELQSTLCKQLPKWVWCRVLDAQRFVKRVHALLIYCYSIAMYYSQKAVWVMMLSCIANFLLPPFQKNCRYPVQDNTRVYLTQKYCRAIKRFWRFD